MTKFPLDLNTLAPKEAEFTLSSNPELKLTLCRFSLRVRAWAFDTYGPARLKEIFEKHHIIPISEMAFFMLKEKEVFKTVADFQDAVITTGDQVTLIKALLTSVGIGEPEIEKIHNDIEKKAAGSPDPNSRRPKKKS